MFREAVIWEFALWGDGRIAIKWWLVTERRCGVRIKQLMLRMARLTYGVWGTRVIWCQIVLGKLETSVEGGCPHSPHSTPLFTLPSAQPPALLRFCYSTWFGLASNSLVFYCSCVSYWVFESFVLVLYTTGVWSLVDCVFPWGWFLCTIVDQQI